MLIHKWDILTSPYEAQGTQKKRVWILDWGSQRMGRNADNCCFLDMTWWLQ